jgi:hypothetical protein
VVLSDQAVDIKGAQFNLIALRLAQPRRSARLIVFLLGAARGASKGDGPGRSSFMARFARTLG